MERHEITPVPGRWWGLAALALCSLVVGLDVTILVTALGRYLPTLRPP